MGSGREGEGLLSCRRIGLLDFGGQFKGGDDCRLYSVYLCVLGGGAAVVSVQTASLVLLCRWSYSNPLGSFWFVALWCLWAFVAPFSRGMNQFLFVGVVTRSLTARSVDSPAGALL